MYELLSPAGNAECLRAAVAAGADAVYLGMKTLSARAGAENFDLSALRQARRLCSETGVKLYVTLNTLMFDKEQSQVTDALFQLADLHADGIIVQDPAVALLAKSLVPDLPLHASTQMAVHSLQGVRVLEQLGFCRVVLARELSLKEIEAITRQTNLEIEVFVHGALCMSYSGHCYFSSVIGQNSGNRGRCAQPCRLPYEEGYPLSLKDLCALEHIQTLKSLGVTSFKIEGRLKSREYVSAVTAAYRRVLDGAAPDAATLRRLADIFSRDGFTDGYLTGHIGADMFGTKKPTDYKTYKNAVQDLPLEKPYKRIGVSLTVKAPPDQPSHFTLTDGEHSVTVKGAPAQAAQGKPLSEESLKNKFDKLADTAFYLKDVVLEDQNSFLPVSAVNAARREAVLRLQQARQEKPLPYTGLLPQLPEAIPQGVACRQLLFHNADAIADLDLTAYDRVWLPPDQLDRYNGKNRGVWIDHFTSDRRLLEILQNARDKTDTVLVGNIGHIAPARKLGFTVEGDYALNITNSYALAFYAKLGLRRACLSFELSASQVRDLQKCIPCTLICYGRLPLMRFKNCVIRPKGCLNFNGFSSLTDRKGARFLLSCAPDHGNTLFNSVPLSLHDCNPPVAAYRFDFTEESAREIADILNTFDHGTFDRPYTRGLYHRAVR